MPIEYPEAVERMASAHPLLRSCLTDLLADWAPEEPGITITFAEFARAFIEIAQADRQAGIAILDLIESLREQGGDDVRDAVQTGFLEVLSNIDPPADLWRPYLGPKSRAGVESWEGFRETGHP